MPVKVNKLFKFYLIIKNYYQENLKFQFNVIFLIYFSKCKYSNETKLINKNELTLGKNENNF